MILSPVDDEQWYWVPHTNIHHNCTTQWSSCNIPDCNLKDPRVRWPSVLDFLGQSQFFTICSGKNHSSPGSPICPVFCLVSRICPDLPISADVYLCIGGQKLAQILSLYTKKSLAAGALPWTLLRELSTLPIPLSRAPDGSRLWHLRYGHLCLWRLSQIVVPKLWSPYPRVKSYHG